MLRIWDCFLFEGPKVLFRFTIALLGLYQDEILNHSDTISVMKLLKSAVRHTYDADGMIRVSQVHAVVSVLVVYLLTKFAGGVRRIKSIPQQAVLEGQAGPISGSAAREAVQAAAAA